MISEASESESQAMMGDSDVEILDGPAAPPEAANGAKQIAALLYSLARTQVVVIYPLPL